MDLDRYGEEAGKHAHEILEELVASGIPALALACRKMGTVGIQVFLLENENGSRQYVSATPSARKRLLHKVPAERRALFLLVALYQCRCAMNLLEAVYRRG